MSTEVAVVEHTGAIARQEDFSPDIVLKRLNAIKSLMKAAMEDGVDYGIVPGTNSKPTLLKPGAEKLCVMFRLAPKYRTQKTHHPDGHMTVETTCQIYDMAENFLGEASAMCSSRESKYAWRKASRVCPRCGKDTILKSKFPPREDPSAAPGWYCFAKKGGCGANFAADDQSITTQTEGRVPNPDIADSYNTVLRIAEKRALIGAVRLVTGSSALFDEEIPEKTEREPDHTEELPNAAVVKEWTVWLDADPKLSEVNEKLDAIRGIDHAPTRKAVWAVVKSRAEAAGLVYDVEGKGFRESAPAGGPVPF